MWSETKAEMVIGILEGLREAPKVSDGGVFRSSAIAPEEKRPSLLFQTRIAAC